jgi:fibronectin type 3 domain-containing protein
MLSFLILFYLLPTSGKAQSVPGTTHKVSLTWTAPSLIGGSNVVQGYNIYRLLIPTTTYAKINPSLILTTTYIDTTVVSGAAYDYEATTVDSGNSESVGSVPFLANIPTNPNPPAALTVVVQ